MMQPSTPKNLRVQRGCVICSDPCTDSPIRAVRGNTLPIYRGKDYTGQSINDWTVLGPIQCLKGTSRTKYRTDWLCQCKCGSETKWVPKQNLVHGRSKGCHACYGTRNSGKDNGNWRGCGEISGEAFNKVRVGAKTRDIDLNVSQDELNELWLNQDRKCALTGMVLIMGETASLDRINSDLGYCLGNVQWVHKTVNIMKNDYSQEVFVEMCRLVAKHFK